MPKTTKTKEVSIPTRVSTRNRDVPDRFAPCGKTLVKPVRPKRKSNAATTKTIEKGPRGSSKQAVVASKKKKSIAASKVKPGSTAGITKEKKSAKGGRKIDGKEEIQKRTQKRRNRSPVRRKSEKKKERSEGTKAKCADSHSSSSSL